MSADQIDASREHDEQVPSWTEVFAEFLFLGVVMLGDSATKVTRIGRHIVERRKWLATEDFEKAIEFCKLLPGPETLQLAIYVGYVKRRVAGGLLAGIAFVLPAALLMLLLSRLYMEYVNLPRVSAILFVLKPTVLGIITAAAVKIAAASIRNFFFAAIMLASCAALYFSEISLIAVLLAAGLVNVIVSTGLPRLTTKFDNRPVHLLCVTVFTLPFLHPHWLRLIWLSLKTGLFSFGGAYASLAFLQQGAVEGHRWVSAAQLLDGIALTVATPGPFMLLSTFVGYLAGGSEGGLLATVFVLLPTFVLVLTGARYAARITASSVAQAFLNGVTASLAGVFIIVVLQLAQGVVLRPPTVIIALVVFMANVLLKVDIALIAMIAIVGGIGYAFFPGTI